MIFALIRTTWLPMTAAMTVVALHAAPAFVDQSPKQHDGDQRPVAPTVVEGDAPTVTTTRAEIRVGSEQVEVDLGEFQVPEFHARAGSRRMTLHYLRLPSRSATPGPPIVYLAGGPGVSGIAAAGGPRWWSLFDSLRGVADVILLDQRGTGRSGSLPRCTTGEVVPDDLPTTRENFVRVFAKQVRHCREFWSAEGVNLAAYTTRESAADLNDLRRALGVPQLDLLAISYGTHLALAALKFHPASFRNAVLLSPEGLDDTVKDPQATDAFFARVQASINADPKARAAYPDIAAMMRRVIAHANATPVPVAAARGPADARILLGGFELQRMAADRLGDPSDTAQVLAAFAAADRGDWSVLGAWAQRQTGEPIFLSPMALAMDAASGASAARRARVRQLAPSTILGDALGYPVLHAEDALADLDLGEAFRAPFRSSHRALIVSGTLDGRTYPEAHREVAAMFAAPLFVSVINGGHDTVTPAQQRIRSFLINQPVSTEPVVVPAPRWLAPRPADVPRPPTAPAAPTSTGPAVPVAFGGDTLSSGRIYRGTFTPDGRTLYFFKNVTPGREDYRIFRSDLHNGAWTAPQMIVLGGEYSDLYPNLSTDGRRMVFSSYRPAPGDSSTRPNAHLWYVDRQGDGWGAPVFMSAANAIGSYHPSPQLGPDGSVTFNRISPGGERRVLQSRWNGTAFETAEPFADIERWRTWRSDLFIGGGSPGPDGTFIVLYVSRLDPQSNRPGPLDLWVTFRRGDTWSEPRPMDPLINSGGAEGFVFYSPDGLDLYFIRDNTTFFRVPLKAALDSAR